MASSTSSYASCATTPCASGASESGGRVPLPSGWVGGLAELLLTSPLPLPHCPSPRGHQGLLFWPPPLRLLGCRRLRPREHGPACSCWSRADATRGLEMASRAWTCSCAEDEGCGVCLGQGCGRAFEPAACQLQVTTDAGHPAVTRCISLSRYKRILPNSHSRPCRVTPARARALLSVAGFPIWKVGG